MVVLSRWSWRIFNSIQVKFLLPPYAPLPEWGGFCTAVPDIPGKHTGIREPGLTEMLLEGQGAVGSWFRGVGRICPVSCERRVESCRRSSSLGADNLCVSRPHFE